MLLKIILFFIPLGSAFLPKGSWPTSGDIRPYFSLRQWEESLLRPRASHLENRFNYTHGSRQWAGVVMDSRGRCFVSRGDYPASCRARQELKEGDQLFTGPQGSIWFLLLDGSSLRLGPNSSLTVKEVAVAPSRIFINAELHQGALFWATRSKNLFSWRKGATQSTDTPYDKVKFIPANSRNRTYGEGPIKDLKRLNALISFNNGLLTSEIESEAWLSTPHLLVQAKGLRGIVVADTKKTYIRPIKASFWGEKGIDEDRPFLSFGLGSQQTLTHSTDEWNVYNAKGNIGTVIPEFKYFAALEAFKWSIKRVPRVLMTREYFVRAYLVPRWRERSLKKLIDHFALMPYSEKAYKKLLSERGKDLRKVSLEGLKERKIWWEINGDYADHLFWDNLQNSFERNANDYMRQLKSRPINEGHTHAQGLTPRSR